MSPAAAPRVLVAEDDPAILSLIRSFERISDDDRRRDRRDRHRGSKDVPQGRAIFRGAGGRRPGRSSV